MLCLDDYCYPVWFEGIVDRIGNLRHHAFLDLRASRNAFHYSSELGNPDNSPLFIGHIADVDVAEKRQQMVLAHGIKGDVFQNHHFMMTEFKPDA